MAFVLYHLSWTFDSYQASPSLVAKRRWQADRNVRTTSASFSTAVLPGVAAFHVNPLVFGAGRLLICTFAYLTVVLLMFFPSPGTVELRLLPDNHQVMVRLSYALSCPTVCMLLYNDASLGYAQTSRNSRWPHYVD